MQTQESVNEQYISEDGKEIRYSHPVIAHAIFCNKNLDHPILIKECVTVLFYLCYVYVLKLNEQILKADCIKIWLERKDGIEIKIFFGLCILIDAYKSKKL